MRANNYIRLVSKVLFVVVYSVSTGHDAATTILKDASSNYTGNEIFPSNFTANNRSSGKGETVRISTNHSVGLMVTNALSQSVRYNMSTPKEKSDTRIRPDLVGPTTTKAKTSGSFRLGLQHVWLIVMLASLLATICSIGIFVGRLLYMGTNYWKQAGSYRLY